MNVTLNKVDNVNGNITVSLQPADYQGEVKKQINELGRTRAIKGFRPGHVPPALLKKLFGSQAMVNVVDRMASKALYDYIVENKLRILGEPMLNKDTKVDLTQETEHTFIFDVGFMPEIEVKVADITIPYYNIKVSDEMVANQNDVFKKRYGKQVPGEVSAKDSLMRGSMVELNEDGTDKAEGITVERTVISPQYLKDEVQAEFFVGRKVGDDITFNPQDAAGGSAAEIAGMLNIDKAQAPEVKSDFRFHVEEILVNQEAEMNQELFDAVLGKDVAKSEEEYLEKVKEMLVGQLKNDSNYRFTVDAKEAIMAAAGADTMELPDEFLKRFLASRAENAEEAKRVEEDYPRSSEQIKWQLIRDKVADDLKVTVTSDDRMRLARFYTAQQFAQYGMGNLPDDVLDRYAADMLKDERMAADIDTRAHEDKTYETIRNTAKIKEKSVTVDEFNNLFKKEEEKK